MTRKKYKVAIATMTLLAASACFGGAQAPQVDDTALRSAASSPEQWLTIGRDYAETRFSPLKQIDASNVGRLGLVL
jgi:quinohemoprotein ethanol dehydrogenase